MKNEAFYIVFCIVSVLGVSCDSWNRMWGDHSLGNNLSLLEGDKKEDRVIVYCSGKSAGACIGGIYVVPTYERHYEGRSYAEYVQATRSNKKWVIAKTFRIKESRENYWIINKEFNIQDVDCGKINCDSILQSYVQGPFDKNTFTEKEN